MAEDIFVHAKADVANSELGEREKLYALITVTGAIRPDEALG